MHVYEPCVWRPNHTIWLSYFPNSSNKYGYMFDNFLSHLKSLAANSIRSLKRETDIVLSVAPHQSRAHPPPAVWRNRNVIHLAPNTGRPGDARPINSPPQQRLSTLRCRRDVTAGRRKAHREDGSVGRNTQGYVQGTAARVPYLR